MNREKFCGRNSSNSTREEREKMLRDRKKEEDRFTVFLTSLKICYIVIRSQIWIFLLFNASTSKIVDLNVKKKAFLFFRGPRQFENFIFS